MGNTWHHARVRNWYGFSLRPIILWLASFSVDLSNLSLTSTSFFSLQWCVCAQIPNYLYLHCSHVLNWLMPSHLHVSLPCAAFYASPATLSLATASLLTFKFYDAGLYHNRWTWFSGLLPRAASGRLHVVVTYTAVALRGPMYFLYDHNFGTAFPVLPYAHSKLYFRSYSFPFLFVSLFVLILRHMWNMFFSIADRLVIFCTVLFSWHYFCVYTCKVVSTVKYRRDSTWGYSILC